MPSDQGVAGWKPAARTDVYTFGVENIVDINALNNVRAWTKGVEVEYDAVAQVKNIASLPIIAGHVAIMPDVHLGKGATVGSVIRLAGDHPRGGGCRYRLRLGAVRTV